MVDRITCPEQNLATCRPVEMMADRWLADYAAHSKALARANEKLEAFGTRLDDLTPKIEHAIHVATVAAAMLPALEKKGEATLAEAVNALVKSESNEGRIRAHEKRIDELAGAAVGRLAPKAARRAVRGPAWAMALVGLLSAGAAWYAAVHPPRPSVPAAAAASAR